MKIIIFSAPSGCGKSTIINHLMAQNLPLRFSISATSRPPRGDERDGVEYFFLEPQEFRKKIAEGAFLEYQEVYKDRFYGTLKCEVDRQLSLGYHLVCDVDVIGAGHIKEAYGEQALSIFLRPPSLQALRKRLEARATESPQAIDARLERAKFELSFAHKFDAIVVNDDLRAAQEETLRIVQAFLSR